jgi:hypothetical protein
LPVKALIESRGTADSLAWDGWSELIDVVLMIDAPGFRCGRALLQSRNIAVTLTANVYSHASSVISSRVFFWKTKEFS